MKAIIIGATSGIGRELAIQMTAKGYELGITGRRAELLETLNAELGGKSHLKVMDITSFEEARQQLFDLIAAMGGVDIVVINSGAGSGRPRLARGSARGAGPCGRPGRGSARGSPRRRCR